ncbi:hypothetical protein QJS83_08905 [Bdellovibrio sp. 22V]|uniref:hypothetical protein n=1 Tax=Bdellovibrio sp. 22V TaxID=3044166 RepID=UPI002542EC17|nr:hypothetical protein [Bdellovibrio sp. 22V]WII70575.1 hypothetical protein QJS83_08905 [Bdellovibrio sp. 22V]
MKFAIILSVLLSVNAFAAEKAADKKQAVDESLSIAKDTKIDVDFYDESSDTFEIVIIKEPGVGPNVVTPEALHKAAGINLDLKTFKTKKRDYVGAEFTLIEKLPLLREEEVAKRRDK